jgi:hypothetical protein
LKELKDLFLFFVCVGFFFFYYSYVHTRLGSFQDLFLNVLMRLKLESYNLQTRVSFELCCMHLMLSEIFLRHVLWKLEKQTN